MNKLRVDATIGNLEHVIAFLDDLMEEYDLPMKARMQIDIAVEEIYVNIAHYAYPDQEGSAEVLVDFPEKGIITVSFIDQGLPYDPLKKPDPDITLSAEERPIGGLGIYMVKKSMDDVAYEYVDGSNRLTITKVYGK